MIKQFVYLCVLSTALAYAYLYDENVTDVVTESSYVDKYKDHCWGKTCPPAYHCPEWSPNKPCIVNEESCEKYYLVDEYKNTRWRPACRSDGSWEPKQCKDDRCFCYDDKGNRIFGQAFANQAANMSCECSRQRALIEAEHEYYLFVNVDLHCDDMGNYEPLQCDQGRCWCTNPSGDDRFPIPPWIEDIKCYSQCCQIVWSRGLTTDDFFSCYRICSEREKTGSTVENKEPVADQSQYRRACEVELYAQEDVRAELRKPSALRRCLYDGSYGPVNIINGYAQCIWRDQTPLGYKVNLQEVMYRENLTCNCAVDAKIYADNGLLFTRTCLDNGNYDPVQRDGCKYFCVDKDGYRISDIQKEELTVWDCKKIKH